ncbi:MAG: hypothetical protein GY769_22305, partial [bacterium]|nr:hypothetical protein [bacterium]
MMAWDPADFDHHEFFELKGAHKETTCDSCHTGGPYAGTSTDCYSCHRADFEETKDPDHQNAGFAPTCASCHDESTWLGASFEHDSFFRLSGAHRKAACGGCHQNGVFAGTPRDCFSCHQADYDQTTNPNHAAVGFSTTCQSCHTQKNWEGAEFDHDLVFKLTGAHRSAACESCHQGGVYTGTPRDCFSCHQSDYDGTTDPNHMAAGFPTSCKTCHGTDRWKGAAFDHDQLFRLTGAHRKADCDSCHQSGVYKGTPRDCVSCHQSEYDGTADPNHVAAGFPTSCETCHETDRWEG